MKHLLATMLTLAASVLLGGCGEGAIEEQCAAVATGVGESVVVRMAEGVPLETMMRQDTKTIPEDERTLLWNRAVLFALTGIESRDPDAALVIAFSVSGFDVMELLSVLDKGKENLEIPEAERLHPQVAEYVEDWLATRDEGTHLVDWATKVRGHLP